MKDKKWSYILALVVFLVAYSLLYYASAPGLTINVAPMFSLLEDPDYLANDWLVSKVKEFNPRTYYVQTMGFFNFFFRDIQLTHLIIYLVVSSLIFINFFYLSDMFFNDKKKSFYIAFLGFMVSTYSLDKTYLVKNLLIPGSVGWLFFLISINFYFRKKYTLGFLMAGISSLFHPVIGTINFAILVGDIVLNKEFRFKDKLFTSVKTIPFFLLYALSVIPLTMINARTSSPYLAKYASTIIGWFMYPVHIIPSSWNISRYLVFIFLMFFFYLAIRKSSCSGTYKKKIRNFALVIAVICFMGYFFVEVIPISPVVKMQLFRSTIVLNIFAYIFIGDYVYNRIKAKSNYLEKIFFIFLPLAFLATQTVFIGVSIFLILEVLKRFRLDVFKFLTKDRTFFFIFVVLSFALLMIAIKQIPLLQHFVVAYPLTILFYLFFPPTAMYLLALLYLKIKKLRAGIITIGVVFIVVLFLFNSPLNYPYPYDQETIELFDFVRSETPKNTIILSPPGFIRFRIGTERAIVVDYEGPYFDSELVEWYQRMQDVSNNMIKEPKTSDKMRADEYYQTLDKEDVLRLKEKYNFAYAVFAQPKNIGLPKLFENGKYVVYEVNNAGLG